MKIIYEGGVRDAKELIGNVSPSIDQFFASVIKHLDIDHVDLRGEVRISQNFINDERRVDDLSYPELRISTMKRNYDGRSFFNFRGLDEEDSSIDNIIGILETVALSKDTVTLSYSGEEKRGELRKSDLSLSDNATDYISAPKGSLEFLAQRGFKLRSTIEVKNETAPANYVEKHPVVVYENMAGSNGISVPCIDITTYGKTKGMSSFVKEISKKMPMSTITLYDAEAKGRRETVYQGAVWEDGNARPATKDDLKRMKKEKKAWQAYERTFDQCFSAFRGFYHASWGEGETDKYLRELADQGVAPDVAAGVVLVEYLRDSVIQDIHSSGRLMQSKLGDGTTVFQSEIEKNITNVSNYLARAHGEDQSLRSKGCNLVNGMPSTGMSSGEYFAEIHRLNRDV